MKTISLILILAAAFLVAYFSINQMRFDQKIQDEFDNMNK